MILSIQIQKKDRQISFSLKKIIAYCVRNRCTCSVDSVHISWRQEERDAIAIWIQKRIDSSHSRPLQKYVAIQRSHIV